MALATLQVRREVVARDPGHGHTRTESGGIEMMMPYGASRMTAAQRVSEGEGFHEEVLQDP